MSGDQVLDADVIVAGAGPAGAAAACHLARSGMRVVVIDRATFPRDKVCGDCVAPAALVELGTLGVTGIEEFARTNVVRRGALYRDGEELISLPFPEVAGVPQHGRVIPRLILDRLIVDTARQAGASLVEGTRLTGVSVAQDGVSVEIVGPGGKSTLRAQLLIGADGSNSMVARVVRGAMPPRQDRMVAARAYFTDVEGPEDQLEVYVNSDCFPGYYWLFPTGHGEANVGLGIPLEALPAHDRAPAAMLRHVLHNDPALARRLRHATPRGVMAGWPLMTFNQGLPIISDRIMLVGDAAGLINPINGEGIQYALLSARWAAEVAAGCLRDGEFTAPALAPYANRVERELVCDMALSRFVVHCIGNRALTPVWLQLMKLMSERAQRDPQYSRIMAGVFAGLLPSRDAMDLAVVTGTIEQAARTIATSAVSTALGGPGAWVDAGLDAARLGRDMAYHAITNAPGLTNWMTVTATRGADVLLQTLRQRYAGNFPPAER